jgi:hypothetical protein
VDVFVVVSVGGFLGYSLPVVDLLFRQLMAITKINSKLTACRILVVFIEDIFILFTPKKRKIIPI